MTGVSTSAAAVPYSRIRELAELAMKLDAESAGDDRVLRLYFGESNIPTPEFIKRAAQKAMRRKYPRAKLYRLPRGGHYPYITRAADFTKIVARHLPRR